MQENLDTLITLNKKAKTFVIISIIVLAAAILYFVLTDLLGITTISLLVVGLVLVAGLLFCYGISTHKKFTSLFKENVVKNALSKVFDNLVFEPQNGISEHTVRSTGMMSLGNLYSANDFISGKYKGVQFCQSDVHIQDKRTDSDGHSTTITLFKGRWMIFEFNKDFAFNLQIESKGFMSSRHTGIFTKKADRRRKIELENEEFNKVFRVYAVNQEESFYIITPKIMEALLNLKAQLKAPIMLMFVKGTLHIALQNNKDAFEPRLFSKFDIDYETEKILKDINVITGFIDEMSLDDDIYKVKENVI